MQFERIIVAQFQCQDCDLTLREAVEEFYQVNADIFSKPDPKTTWTKLLVHHDVSHVVFGVNTSLVDEASGDFWTIFGTTMSFKEYGEYIKTPEAKNLLKEIGFFNLIKILFYSVPLFFKIYVRSSKMHRKWDFNHYDEFMDQPLRTVRKHFNLEIIT